ncbi:glycosyltransferase [Planomonospora algeriensis]
MTGPQTPCPRIRGNDYGVLGPPALGTWEPRLSVSVVIPARQCQDKLDLVLAALAAQSYPAHLTEVVVVDDGSAPPLRVPEIAPERTRVIRSSPGGWGIAWALASGEAVAEGQVIHRLDADVVPYRDHVEAHMRWHHLAGYLVVTGTLRFTAAAGPPPAPAEVRDAVAAGGPRPSSSPTTTTGTTGSTGSSPSTTASATRPARSCTGSTSARRCPSLPRC